MDLAGPVRVLVIASILTEPAVRAVYHFTSHHSGPVDSRPAFSQGTLRLTTAAACSVD